MQKLRFPEGEHEFDLRSCGRGTVLGGGEEEAAPTDRSVALPCWSVEGVSGLALLLEDEDEGATGRTEETRTRARRARQKRGCEPRTRAEGEDDDMGVAACTEAEDEDEDPPHELEKRARSDERRTAGVTVWRSVGGSNA
jgi:hypothetical protein